MSNTSIETLIPGVVMVLPDQMKKVDYFIAYDKGMRTGGHGIRPKATPQFTVLISGEMNDHVESEYEATIVASNVPMHDTSQVRYGTPLAVAEVLIDDKSWYLIFTRGSGLIERNLNPSDMLVQYEGEPEDLLEQPDLFLPAE